MSGGVSALRDRLQQALQLGAAGAAGAEALQTAGGSVRRRVRPQRAHRPNGHRQAVPVLWVVASFSNATVFDFFFKTGLGLSSVPHLGIYMTLTRK